MAQKPKTEHNSLVSGLPYQMVVVGQLVQRNGGCGILCLPLQGGGDSRYV